TGGIPTAPLFGRDLKKCMELKRVYLQYQSAPSGQPKGSLKSLGSPLSVYIYEVDNQKKNIVSFFQGDRGFIEINGETIHLSSLLLGLQGKHIHASYRSLSE
ncbi:PsaF/MyfF family fimbrial adhesin regulatory protein, partial [Yersinia enterocolitica]|uniref:PsaF/MyfF family fimbrial adhesin regulatory protein n=1 Tax=Yersinia enterocolitica TaxID=630 RepID=UPI0021E9203F